ncbi:MAG: trimethylamine methyltransferase family protein, partial [Pseudomonadota bacterium]
MEEPRAVRRRGRGGDGEGSGRAARVARRKAPAPAINPAPPGQKGGAYRPLSEADIEAIWRTALRLLAELGMGDAPPALVEAATAQGAEVNALGRLAFPASMIEDIVANAPRRFIFHGRDPARSFEIGGDAVHFGTGGAAVQTLDLDTGRYRPSTLADLHDFTRLQDALTNISWFTRCCVATDVEESIDLDI